MSLYGAKSGNEELAMRQIFFNLNKQKLRICLTNLAQEVETMITEAERIVKNKLQIRLAKKCGKNLMYSDDEQNRI